MAIRQYVPYHMMQEDNFDFGGAGGGGGTKGVRVQL